MIVTIGLTDEHTDALFICSSKVLLLFNDAK